MSPRSLADLPPPSLAELVNVEHMYPDGHELRRLVAEIVRDRAQLREMDALRERVQQAWSREKHALRLVALCNLQALLGQECRRVGSWPGEFNSGATYAAVLRSPRLEELRAIWYRHPKGHVARQLTEEIARYRALLEQIEALCVGVQRAWDEETTGVPLDPMRRMLLLLNAERQRFA